MTRLLNYLDKLLAGFLVFLMGIMVVAVTWQVFTRYVLGAPSSYTQELATFLLIWISLLGAVYTLRRGEHIGLDWLVEKLDAERRKRIDIIVYIVIIVFSAVVLLYGGIRLVVFNYALGQVSASFQIPMAYVYGVIPLSGLLMILYSIGGIVQLMRGETLDATENEDIRTLNDNANQSGGISEG